MGNKVKQEAIAAVEYEHRKGNGTLVSRGRQIIDRHRNVHYIQEDAKGRKVGEAIFDKFNNLLEIKEGNLKNRSLFTRFVKSLKGGD